MVDSRCKYYKQVKQVTYDFGQTWTNTTVYRKGALYEYDSEDCGYDYKNQYLTLKANTTSGYVKLNNAPSTFYYSTDSGNTWTSATSADTIPLTTGGTMFKGTITPSTSAPYGVGTFSASTPFTAESNVMSLLYGDNFSDKISLSGKADAFYSLFRGSSITNAENLVLLATILEYNCYNGMFRYCSSLTTAPALPATTLAEWCYSDMFSDCTSLTTAPALPATTLAIGCYAGMFIGCTSLTTTPELPATTLANLCYNGMFKGCSGLTSVPSDYLPVTTLARSCYWSMFEGCTSLTTAPALPATTLASECYSAMFSGCTSLTTAPVLSATTLAEACYWAMFYGCSNLNYIKCLATNISASYCTDSWVNGVASSGTFVKNSSMSSWTTGNSGIPNGWTVQDA